ncbi:glutathione-dependent reductase [Iodidimonas nitroreducens]|uniref:Glutathione-dependent reductase n=1 Tax=Iodidimonas nitroreducens TaxID=1236968 RepID=A0A5A7N8J2_9PROT|nr:glutathione S-transferase family protein [Iodidimonas nitroreducens]GAK33707.1 glutathionyl-hydroquinone reductase YqjG [alpha proteobacterium Q-1]GER03945.1 glutathione-dependent reductase [Iodidimonas nitroreducens]
MGLLVDGQWQDAWYDTKSNGGAFKRPDTRFRNGISADGSGDFSAEAGRYHLYIAHACPWANRAMILRHLKGLQDIISVSVVHWHMDDEGWRFDDSTPGATIDHIHGFQRLHQVYTKSDPHYSGRVTVPVLWDKKTSRIVNNESAEITRILNSAFDTVPGIGHPERDYYPKDLQLEIDAINERIYHAINNGVYKAGFATTQSAYEEAFDALFETLDAMDERLATRRYLLGERLTEADWRFFTTLVRFDAVYVGHFKCNKKRIADYPHLSGYLRELYQMPGIADTVVFDHIKLHYYQSHGSINPTGIVPKGPDLDLGQPHNRNHLKAA